MVQDTCMLAGTQLRFPTAHEKGVGLVELGVAAAVVAVCPAICTPNSLLTVEAVKAGGADPKGANRPSIHSALTPVVSGMASAPLLTEKLVATGSAAALVPLPANA